MGSIRIIPLVLLLSAALAAGSIACATKAEARGSNSGSGSSGSSGSGSSGSSNSGSNSGHGGGEDHSGRGGGEDDGGNDGSGRPGDSDPDYVRKAVKDGRILPLKSVLKKIDGKHYGKVIDVRVTRSFFRDVYQLKFRDSMGAIRTLRVDARHGTLLGEK